MIDRIRPANVWDAPAIARMWGRLAKESSILGMDGDAIALTKYLMAVYFQMGMRQGKAFFYVAEKDGAVIGYISGRIATKPYGHEGLVGTCDYIYIEPEARGGNVHAGLMERLYNAFLKAGVNMLEMHTPFSEKLINRYAKKGGMVYNGFEPVEIIYRKKVG